LIARAGAPGPFGRADGQPRRLAGPRLAAPTGRRVTEAAGDASRRRRRAGEPGRAGRPAAWDFTPPGRDGRSFPGAVAYRGVRRWLWAEGVLPQAGARAAAEKRPAPVRDLLVAALAPAA
jgi:hypothetical protein